MTQHQNPPDKLRTLLRRCKKAFFYVTLFSVLVNMLMLTVPLYMLQLFDRVLVSQSYDTLIYLCVIAVFAITIYALLEFLRGRILSEVGNWIDSKISLDVIMKSIDRVLQADRYAYCAQGDIATIRNFSKSPSVISFLDMPWFPIYLLAIFVISPILGIVALMGAIILFVLAYLNQKLSENELMEASKLSITNSLSIDGILNNAETVQSMGMANAFLKKWFLKSTKLLAFQSASSYRVGLISTLSKFFRIIVQISILTVGALYVIRGQLTGGAMIAASIITGRALAPVEQSISAWKEFFSAKEAFKRLRAFINLPNLRPKSIRLPKAKGEISCDDLIYIPAGCAQPILQNISFKLSPGESLALLGPSGAGKSTLARLTLGIWPATRGSIRLDDADVYTWDRENFGEQVGYLPQDNGLIEGTIKENIACLETDFRDEDVIEAAKMANAHEMILHLPKAYDTPVSEYHLSGGQAKRVALARAFYKNPCFIVLDEPETHLDAQGEVALIKAVEKIKSQHQTTLIIITRHLKLIKMLDKALVLRDGKTQAIDTTDNVLNKMRGSSENAR